MAKKDIKKALKDFWYGKPHSAEEGGRRLGELYEDKTGLLKHREWRGVKDTFYYMYMIWGYNYIHMVTDILKYSKNPIDFVKGTWRYRWMGQTYLPVIHWFERGLQGMRGEALAASAWHYRAMVSASIQQICNFFNGGEIPEVEEGKTYNVTGIVLISQANVVRVYITEMTEVAAAGLRGDVNLDEVVNIADVTSLIDYLLSGDATGISIENANCNQDEGVNIADVTSLIDYLLSGNWPADE